jgi:tRNA(fMet)-specific endonuclease VapC
VEAELWHGSEKYGIPERRRADLVAILSPYRSLPFDSVCVRHYARIRHLLESSGQTIGGHDLMIAAIALTHGLILVTHNTSEFSRVSDLKVEDWILPPN